VSERERERERESLSLSVCVCVVRYKTTFPFIIYKVQRRKCSE